MCPYGRHIKRTSLLYPFFAHFASRAFSRIILADRMRSRRRQLWIALIVVVVLAGAIVVAILLRKAAAPEVARLLPDSDAVFYINLEPIRLLTGLGKKPVTDRDPEYEQFVQETGFDFERDLDHAAFAIHYGQRNDEETRYSEILQGHFDHSRVSQYLAKLSNNAIEHYQGFDIYAIPLEGRTLRVALLGLDTAAASNNPEPGFIHYMIDHYKESALPFAGPALVRHYYRRVPLGSVAWTIARMPQQASMQDHGELLIPGGWSSLLPRGSVVIASARPLTEVHLRAQVITDSETQARSFAGKLEAFLALFNSIDISMDAGGPDPDAKRVFESLQVKQEKNEAVVTASVPFAFFRKIVSESPVEIVPQTQKPPEKIPAAPQKPKNKK